MTNKDILISGIGGIYKLNFKNYKCIIENVFKKDINNTSDHLGLSLIADDKFLYHSVSNRFPKNQDIPVKTTIFKINKETMEECNSVIDDNPDIHKLIFWDEYILAVSVNGNVAKYNKDLELIENIINLCDLVPSHLTHESFFTTNNKTSKFLNIDNNIYHFNSILIYENTLYALAHNIQYPSFIIKYDLSSKAVEAIVLENAWYHDLFIIDNKIITNNSPNSLIEVYDLETLSFINSFKLDGFLRGIVEDGEDIFIGSSMNKFENSNIPSKIFILNKQTFEVVQTIMVEDPAFIYDLVIM